MGQMYLAANLSKREYMDPFRFGKTTKLGEIFASRGFAGLLSVALAIPDWSVAEHPFVGRWAGDQVILVGDFMDWGYVSHMIEEGRIDLPSWLINELKAGYIPPEEGEDIDSYWRRVRRMGGMPTLYSLVKKHFRDISVEAIKFLYREYPEEGLKAAQYILGDYKSGLIGPEYVLELLEDEDIFQALQREMGEELQKILSRIRRSF
jgi:hypothetical protein